MTVQAQQQQQQTPLDAMLEQCRQDLISSDTNTTDGYITLYEYEVFVNERYYKNCAKKVVVSESIAQWEAFTLLACHSCLQESTIIDTIPDCCLPFNNSRIGIYTINSNSNNNSTNLSFNTSQYDWLQRICRTADTAAVDDQCYTFPPTMAPTTITDNNFNNTTNTTVSVFTNNSECANAIVAADGTSGNGNNPDGYISQTEFYNLLQMIVTTKTNHSNSNSKTLSCSVTNDTTIIDAVYVNLVCASCTYTSSTSTRQNIFDAESATARFPNLNCCTSTNATISIVDIGTNTTTITPAATAWLSRICTTINSMITCIHTTPTIPNSMVTTMAPIFTNINNNSSTNSSTSSAPMMVPSPSRSSTLPTVTLTNVTMAPMTVNASSINGTTTSPVAVPLTMTAPPNGEITIPTSGIGHDCSWTTMLSLIRMMIVAVVGVVVSMVYV
jgi:hypothetical protein